MNLFLTGASGFLGSRIIEAFAGRHSLRVLVRNPYLQSDFTGRGVECVTGDLESVHESMLEGIEGIIHAAALAKPFGMWEEFRRTNIEGTRHLLDVGQSAGVKQFIYISTEAVCFRGQDLVNVNEDVPVLDRPIYEYGYSKAQAERLVLAASRADFKTVALRPSWIWGPGDTNALPMIVQMVQQGKFMWVDGKARKTTTYVDNLIDAIEAALNAGVQGRAYFINDGEFRPLRDFLAPLLATQDVVAPEKSIPGWLIRAMGRVAETVWRWGGRKGRPAGTRLEADFMSREVVLANDRARQELGWRPRFTIDEGLQNIRPS